MCGFSGFLNFSPNWGDPLILLKKMGGQLVNRGPDGSGEWLDADFGVGLSHRRLSIIDLSEQGHQPMLSASGRFVIAYNGEIYNYQALKKELLQAGISFRGDSDTEVLLAAIESWGMKQALQRCNGMFAFSLWDKKEQTLSLVRDRMGEKPVYYGWQGEGAKRTFLFGSELKSLRQHPVWQGGVDRDALANLLRYNYIPAPQTIHPNIHKLRPGYLLQLKKTTKGWSEKEECWWSLQEVAQQASKNPFMGSRTDAVDQLDKLLKNTIQEQSIADVPLGVFLSGGVDSSSVVAIMQSISNHPVKSFTIGFEDSAYDESSDARAVANHLGTDHNQWIVTADDALSLIPKLPSYYDEPFADVSQIPTLLVSALAKKKVTVALSGDGGDELFAGYNRHQWAPAMLQKMQYFPNAVRKALAVLIKSASPSGWDGFFKAIDPFLPKQLRVRHPGEKIHKIALLLKQNSEEELYAMLVRIWPDPIPLLNGNSYNLVQKHQDLWNLGDSFTERMTRLDSVTYLPDDILTKVDRAAMANSLETRVPLLDHRIVEFAAQLPLHMKIHQGSGKWVLRELLDRYVPRNLMDHPKSGFGVPIGQWLKGPLREWAEELLSEQKLEDGGYFDVKQVRKVWEQHASGKKNQQYKLWSVLMFQAWLESNEL
ncbi:MAG: asparagine synthase (glutamine-hydrolyzing) [Candidatus Ruthia sp.]|nr:asparagine synthase (glutamine-hydrolyzing) [Candidatus Ruthturnera sp.]MBT6756761.1 asparagine synthase (glutamine-hydrolyzing) [Candidatus Jacksonbacteria bacterium]